MLKLRPYDLRAFRQADAKGRVVGGSTAVSSEVTDDLSKRVGDADDHFRELAGKGEGLATVKPYLEKAKKCLADKEYARLHFLLQETWAYRLK